METDPIRILRFLGGGSATVRSGSGSGRTLLDGASRGKICVDTRVLAALAGNGLLVREGMMLSLSSEGEGRLHQAGPETAPMAPPQEVSREESGASVDSPLVGLNHCESPLAHLARRRTRTGASFLGEREVRAGERLRADFTRGLMMPKLGVDWTFSVVRRRRAGDIGAGLELSDSALGARRRVNTALEAVGPELGGILIDVCCFLKGLELVEFERGWPARSAKVILKTALLALARHYEPPRPRPGALLHWGTEDYRPTIS